MFGKKKPVIEGKPVQIVRNPAPKSNRRIAKRAQRLELYIAGMATDDPNRRSYELELEQLRLAQKRAEL